MTTRLETNKLVLGAYLVALLTVAGVGVWAIAIRAVEGLRVTNLTSHVPWGLWVAFYIYFIGLSAGSFLMSTLIYVFGMSRFESIGRSALFVAIVALVAGLAFIFLDLGHLERFWTVFVNRSPTSVLEWEIHFYLLYGIILLAELWLLMRRDLIRAAEGEGLRALVARLLSFGSHDLSEESAHLDRRAVKILGAIGIPVAIAVHGGTGAIFAVVKARPYWYTGLFPIIFIVSALASGGALLLCITALFSRRKGTADHAELVSQLAKIVGAFLLLDLVLLTSEMLVGLYGGVPDHVATYRVIMFGPFWYVFWFGQMGLGALVPLALIFLKRTGNSPFWLGVAGACIVVGILGVRLNIVIPPLSVPLMPGIDTAYPLGRFSTFAFTGFSLHLLQGAVAVFVVAMVVLLSQLWRIPIPSWERWVVRLATTGAIFVLVIMGLRLAGFAPTTSALFDISLATAPTTPLPLFFGGQIKAQDPTFYSPSMIEWLSSTGVIAVAILALSLGRWLLPLEEPPVHPARAVRPRFDSDRIGTERENS